MTSEENEPNYDRARAALTFNKPRPDRLFESSCYIGESPSGVAPSPDSQRGILPAQLQAEPHRPPPGAGTFAFIVVEDDPDDFILLRRALCQAGAAAPVWWAQSAQEALALCDDLASCFATLCVAVDVRLLGTDGFQLCEQLKAPKGSCRTRFAFLTGMSDPATRARAQSLGADAFFVKSSDSAQLLQVAFALQRLAS